MKKGKGKSKENGDISELKQKQEVVTQKFASIVHYSGPLPPPEQLDKYNLIVKEGAERIFVMAEKEQIHRHKIEEIAIKTELKYLKIGQYFGGGIGILSMFIGAVLAFYGHDIVAGTFVTIGVGGLAVTFVVGKNQK